MKSYSGRQRIASWAFWCLYSAALPVGFFVPAFRHALLAHSGWVVAVGLLTTVLFRFLPLTTSVPQVLVFVGSCAIAFGYVSIALWKSTGSFVFAPSGLLFGVLFLVLLRSSQRSRRLHQIG